MIPCLAEWLSGIPIYSDGITPTGIMQGLVTDRVAGEVPQAIPFSSLVLFHCNVAPAISQAAKCQQNSAVRALDTALFDELLVSDPNSAVDVAVIDGRSAPIESIIEIIHWEVRKATGNFLIHVNHEQSQQLLMHQTIKTLLIQQSVIILAIDRKTL